jgi:hypothetical protein
LTRRVFLTCWLVYTALWTPYIVREHFPALSLIEQGTLNVERYAGWSEDIFRSPGGGAYINNNPGASLLAGLVLMPLRPALASVERWDRERPRSAAESRSSKLFTRALSQGRGFYFLLIGFLTVALVMAPATAGTVAYLCSRLLNAGVSAGSAAMASLLTGLATPVLFRAGYLNHNLLAGNAGLVALLLLWDPHSRPLRSSRAVVAGLLAGYAVLCDYSGMVVVAAVALQVWLRVAGSGTPAKLRMLAACGLGVVPGVAALLLYQAWAFGSFYHPSQHFMPPTAPTSSGYRGFDWPSPALAWANLFDPRFGLFAYCPVLLLALASPFVRRVSFLFPRREMLVAFAYFALFVAFCAANQYSWLQPLTGFRYLVPVVPVLALLSMHTAQALPRTVRTTLAGGSAAFSLLLAAAHQNDIRLAPAALWDSGFRTPWMIRLAEADVPIAPPWVLSFWVALAAAIAFLWRRPRRSAAPAKSSRPAVYA